jgi:hypothetical protein
MSLSLLFFFIFVLIYVLGGNSFQKENGGYETENRRCLGQRRFPWCNGSLYPSKMHVI